MIAVAKPVVAAASASAGFVELLPAIRSYALPAFRDDAPGEREELVAATIADAFVAYRRLVSFGKQAVAYATPLARYAVRHVRSGRRVGSPVKQRDVLSPANRRVTCESLQQFDSRDGTWREQLVEDRQAGPAETAAARLDVAHWFRRLPARNRRIARALAAGETTQAVALKFGLTAGRVSQLRRELADSWHALHGEPIGVGYGTRATSS